MDTQIEQLNLSSITKFALAYAGITTVSELKEYNYISLANVLPRNCSLNPIMKELNTYGYIFPPENEIPISSIPMSKRLYNILDRNNILISIPPPSAGGTNSNESVLTLYVVL